MIMLYVARDIGVSQHAWPITSAAVASWQNLVKRKFVAKVIAGVRPKGGVSVKVAMI